MANGKKNPGVVNLQIEEPPFMEKMAQVLPSLPKPLTLEEKKYLLAVERGDLANVRRIIQRAHRKTHLSINCMDSLGRGALTLAIDNENLEMVELLVIMGVETRDALLQAIHAEFVEAVELLLEHEELIHKEGELYSWQKTDVNTAMFTRDVTPLILAAHRNNYEIIKILLDRGATLPMPHDIKCGCEDCLQRSSEDSLRLSLSRVNEYRALSSPSLIALSSSDPLLTAFQLSWELRNLAFAEQECKAEYLELRRKCQQFAVDLLDQSRSSQELAIILNYDPETPPYEDGDHMKLARLELAINYKQKKFVAHPNIQQLLASLWYEGVPGFRRKKPLDKALVIMKVTMLFPLYCGLYIVAPNCATAQLMRKPFMKFLIHASSYLFFLFILILVSQRAEIHAIQLFGTENMKRALQEKLLKQRGAGPTPLELLVVVYVIGFIWEETQEIYSEGIKRLIAYIEQYQEIESDPSTAYIAREHWDDFDPQLIAEGLFAAANIFSALKLVHMFSINPHLGPLQISLGRMVIDIVKFFFIYSLVLFAFACGLNQLLWYFADLEKKKCYALPGGMPDWETASDACMKWRRFGNLFESSQSLFWASFGMVGLETFELAGIKSYTRFWGLLMFGSYSVINVIVLLNLLIAMMSNSYAMIDQHSDTEWKFARTKLWMSYFEESSTLPPPFNIFPTTKLLSKLCRTKKSRRTIQRESTIRRKEERERDNRYTNVMRSLVWRYVSAMHRRMEENNVTEDDINEVKGEISAMRYELLEILDRNGMDVSSADRREKTVLAKRMKIWERRLMKDFQVAPVSTEDLNEIEEIEIPKNESAVAKFRRIAKQVATQSNSYKWGQVMQGVGVNIHSQIGRCHNRASFKNQQNLKKAIAQAKKLVEKSPMKRSGSCSPIELIDPTSSTLIELLKDISEECGNVSPGNALSIDPLNLSRSVSPSLQKELASLVIQKSPNLAAKASVVPKTPEPKSKTVTSTVVKPSSSTISSPPVDDHSKNIICITPASPSTSDNIKSCKSPPPDEIKLNETWSPSPVPIAKSPSPPPLIHIRRIECQSVKIESKFSDNLENSINNIKSRSSSPTTPPLIATEDLSTAKEIAVKSPLHVAKRKPPQLPSEIAVSRPVASKPQPGQGMIPPPPENKMEVPIIEIQPSTPVKPQSQVRSTSPSLTKTSEKKKQPQPTASPVLEDRTGSTEKLVLTSIPSSNANKPPVSPQGFRSTRKIEDAKPFKRVQPKTGWL